MIGQWNLSNRKISCMKKRDGEQLDLKYVQFK